jgi:hypothetical protein
VNVLRFEVYFTISISLIQEDRMNHSKALLPSIALFGMLSVIGCGSDSVMGTDQSSTEAVLIIWDPEPIDDTISLPLTPVEPVVIMIPPDPANTGDKPVKSDIITTAITEELKNTDVVTREAPAKPDSLYVDWNSDPIIWW